MTSRPSARHCASSSTLAPAEKWRGLACLIQSQNRANGTGVHDQRGIVIAPTPSRLLPHREHKLSHRLSTLSRSIIRWAVVTVFIGPQQTFCNPNPSPLPMQPNARHFCGPIYSAICCSRESVPMQPTSTPIQCLLVYLSWNDILSTDDGL